MDQIDNFYLAKSTTGRHVVQAEPLFQHAREKLANIGITISGDGQPILEFSSMAICRKREQTKRDARLANERQTTMRKLPSAALCKDLQREAKICIFRRRKNGKITYKLS